MSPQFVGANNSAIINDLQFYVDNAGTIVVTHAAVANGWATSGLKGWGNFTPLPNTGVVFSYPIY